MKRIFSRFLLLTLLALSGVIAFAPNPPVNKKILFNHRNSATQSIQSSYYLRQILPDVSTLTPEQSDGATLISYNGNLMQMFGWLGGPQSNKYYSSNDLGRTFSLLGTTSFSTAEQEAAIRNDGKIWVWATTDNEIWNYDGSWHFVNNNCPSPLGNVKVLINDQMLIFGGQTSAGASPSISTYVFRYNDLTTIWDTIGQTPSDVWLTTGCCWVSGGYIYACGGAKVNNFNGTYEFLNDKIIKSGDGGVTWTTVATLPVAQRAMWCETCVFDGKVWFLNGYSGGANQAGLWYTPDNGQNWTLFSNTIPGRHATSMCEHDNSLYIGWGNYHNDLWRVEKIIYPTQAFATSEVQTWWEKNWPADRPSNALLTAVNTLFTRLDTAISLNPAKSQRQCLDYFSLIAGLENENQFLVPMLSSNSDYLNGATKVNGNPNWSTAGATSTLGGGNPVYLLNWNPNTHAVNYTLNSAALFEYILSNQTDDFYEYGNASSYILSHSSDNGGRLYGTMNSADFAVDGILSGSGYRGISRTSSSNVDVLFNNIHASVTKSSSSIGGTKLSVCGTENAGATYGSIHLFGAIGAASGDLNQDKMRDALQAFFVQTGIITAPASRTVSNLIVAGGGGGGRETGSGGGGGAVIESTSTVTAGRYYLVTVGAGGGGGFGSGFSDGTGASGGNSSFNGITATGGAGGVGGGNNGLNGGCGSGASRGSSTPGTGSQGGNGGAGGPGSGGDIASAGGGGGAGGNGAAGASGVGGAGGTGYLSVMTGTYYGGGGGGGVYYVSSAIGGAGGNGGGGAGSNSTGSNGTANTGGGGGGGALRNSGAFNGGDGGSGVVKIKYPTGSMTAVGGVTTTSGGNTIHTFTSSAYFFVSTVN